MKSRIKGLVMVVLCWFAFSCEYEPYQNKGQLIYKGTELYDMLDVVFREQSDASCVEFVYPFVINVYDVNEELLSQNDVFNDSDFSELLETLTEGQSISLSFPTTKVVEDGRKSEFYLGVGLGFRYQLSERFNLNINPIFKTNSLTVFSDSPYPKAYIFQVQAGLSYNLRF